jgi:hypothetical protein
MSSVFLFTSALFLSGYALQQKTVRDLRIAVRPAPTPTNARLYLPEQFRPARSPKSDGLGGLDGLGITEKKPGSGGVIVEDNPDNSVSGVKMKPQKHRLPTYENGNQRAMIDESSPPPVDDLKSNLPISQTTEENNLSRAERRRRIKADILAAGEGEGFKGYKRRMW